LQRVTALQRVASLPTMGSASGGTRVFGIGLSRTGTTSLHHAFELLGLRSAPTSVALLDDPHAPLLDQHDAFTDNPIPFMYRQLDERFPGSRFVLTTRPLQPWLESMEWLFGPGIERLDRPTRRLARRVHRQLYGLRRFDAEALTEVYRRHHDDVGTWFARRPHDLLVMDLTDPTLDDRWSPLCAFLGLPRPGRPFPASNRREDPPPPRSIEP
jgi:hypothetical protein